MGQWFLIQNEKVRGPFSTDEIKAQFTNGQLEPDCLIWGRTLSLWQPLSLWMRERAQTPETTARPEQLWHYAIDGNSKGPMPRSELIMELKSIRHKGEILVWTKGMKAWADLFDFHDLLEEMGLNRREHPRAPITGSVVLKYDDKILISVLKSISAGGFGVTQANSQLSIGQVITAEIKSDQLNSPISVKATVQYISDTGFYGFKFQNINMEARAHIMEYLRNSKIIVEQAA